MAHSLSAKKRVRQNAKRRQINHDRKGKVKAQIKRFEQAVESGDADSAGQALQKAVKRIDKTAATSTMHKKTAARRKSKLVKQLKNLQAKQS